MLYISWWSWPWTFRRWCSNVWLSHSVSSLILSIVSASLCLKLGARWSYASSTITHATQCTSHICITLSIQVNLMILTNSPSIVDKSEAPKEAFIFYFLRTPIPSMVLNSDFYKPHILLMHLTDTCWVAKSETGHSSAVPTFLALRLMCKIALLPINDGTFQLDLSAYTTTVWTVISRHLSACPVSAFETKTSEWCFHVGMVVESGQNV